MAISHISFTISNTQCPIQNPSVKPTLCFGTIRPKPKSKTLFVDRKNPSLDPCLSSSARISQVNGFRTLRLGRFIRQSMLENSVKALFTGIVEELGQVKELGFAENGGFVIEICAKVVLEDIKLGDSIAVNGTCLTVTQFDSESFKVGLAPETLRKTSLVELSPGSFVNLERALQPLSRMGGHFVQGHVDGTGEIVSTEPEGDSLWVKVKTSRDLLKFIVPKGYITVDGTSLTVVKVFDNEDCFNFMLVSYTQQKVVIPMKKIGQKVNLEVDILGKYVERLLNTQQ